MDINGYRFLSNTDMLNAHGAWELARLLRERSKPVEPGEGLVNARELNKPAPNNEVEA
jgi:hypothetical protein